MQVLNHEQFASVLKKDDLFFQDIPSQLYLICDGKDHADKIMWIHNILSDIVQQQFHPAKHQRLDSNYCVVSAPLLTRQYQRYVSGRAIYNFYLLLVSILLSIVILTNNRWTLIFCICMLCMLLRLMSWRSEQLTPSCIQMQLIRQLGIHDYGWYSSEL